MCWEMQVPTYHCPSAWTRECILNEKEMMAHALGYLTALFLHRLHAG